MADEHGQQGISIRTTAAAAVALLVMSILWYVYPHNYTARVGTVPKADTASAATSTTQLTSMQELATMATTSIGPMIVSQLLNSYIAMNQSGSYSTSAAALIGQQIGEATPAHAQYVPISNDDVRTVRDTSRKAMLAYRSALQGSLKPLLLNKQSEIGTYSDYIQTQNQSDLTSLTIMSQNYLTAASNTLDIAVPADAVTIQVGIVNAMREFSATLDMMVQEANDPIGAAAALKMYSQAHADMISSFNQLATYISTKQ